MKKLTEECRAIFVGITLDITLNKLHFFIPHEFKFLTEEFESIMKPLASADVLYKLINNEELPDKYRDHQLIGDWHRYRECYLKPDLLLIYKFGNDNTLHLARLGSHSELVN